MNENNHYHRWKKTKNNNNHESVYGRNDGAIANRVERKYSKQAWRKKKYTKRKKKHE